MSSTDTTIETLAERVAELTTAVAQGFRLTGARLTRAEVLERLRVSRNTLDSYIKTKDFPTPGRDGKWLLAEIIEWEARK
jgi:predicted DNA-binding transcriptional regulator AlpA